MKKIFGVSLCLVLSACSWFHSKYTSGLEGQSLPDFEFTSQDSISTSAGYIGQKKQPFILFLFQPNCPFCRSEMEDMLNHLTDLAMVHIYLITTYPYQATKQFSSYYHLDKQSNFTILRDSSGALIDYFKAPVVPYLAFYDGQSKLFKALVGKSSFSDLKEILTDMNVGHLANTPRVGSVPSPISATDE